MKRVQVRKIAGEKPFVFLDGGEEGQDGKMTGGREKVGEETGGSVLRVETSRGSFGCDGSRTRYIHLFDKIHQGKACKSPAIRQGQPVDIMSTSN